MKPQKMLDIGGTQPNAEHDRCSNDTSSTLHFSRIYNT